MEASEIVEVLAAAGVGLELSVRAKGELDDQHRALIREHRDALLEHLAAQHGDPGKIRGSSVQLHGELFHNLMVWAGQWSELRLERPGETTLSARPEYIAEAPERFRWGLVYDQTGAVLVSWGPVPRAAFIGKRDLLTGAVLLPEEMAA